MTKVLLHAHSTYSDDGRLSLHELAIQAGERGFEYILLSDHYEHLTTEKFARLVDEVDQLNKNTGCQIIPGYERSWDGYHVCAYGVNEFSLADKFDVWVQEVHAAGGIVVQAHLVKYQFQVPDFILNAVDGIEIWNSKWPYDWKFYADPRYKKLLKKHHLRLVGQDVHKLSDFTRLGLKLHARASSKESIIYAIKNREFELIPYDPEKIPSGKTTNFFLANSNILRLAMFNFLYRLKKILS